MDHQVEIYHDISTSQGEIGVIIDQLCGSEPGAPAYGAPARNHTLLVGWHLWSWFCGFLCVYITICSAVQSQFLLGKSGFFAGLPSGKLTQLWANGRFSLMSFPNPAEEWSMVNFMVNPADSSTRGSSTRRWPESVGLEQGLLLLVSRQYIKDVL